MHLDDTYSDTHTERYISNTTNSTDLDLFQPLEWSSELEHADRKLEAKADAALHGSIPFQVDRKVLKDVVREKMGNDVARITFLNSGTFHKAYLITLVNSSEIVARVARRFMPRLKTESEVATMAYLRDHTDIQVPTVYYHDSNPYNRLGGEYILMSKANRHVVYPCAKVFHSLSYNELVKLCTNLASLTIPLFAHRFPHFGSLYSRPSSRVADGSSTTTPRPNPHSYMSLTKLPHLTVERSDRDFYVGPIVSWPFFGSNRGELIHPTEINRGPWSSTKEYLASCTERELSGVIRENEGKSAPHKLHLDPDEIRSSWHHQMRAVPDDESDDSDEWDLEESDEEWEGPGDAMYRDYRRMQRTTFLVAHLNQREGKVRREMDRWTNLMDRLSKMIKSDVPEEFSLDCHDLNLENVFVDNDDPTNITCIIDWESTATRPLWACAHLPAFLQSSPFTARLFRQSVAKLAEESTLTTTKQGREIDLATLAKEWLYYEQHGVRLRLAHRFVEWDGWEEGLINTILGSEDIEDEWFADWDATKASGAAGDHSAPLGTADCRGRGLTSAVNEVFLGIPSLTRGAPAVQQRPFVKEKDKEKMLDITGDICGGRGGELGRRLEAWLTVRENGVGLKNRWSGNISEGEVDDE